MSETYSVRRFRALPAKVLAGFVRSSLGGSERYNFGKLVNEGLGNSVSQVQENIVGNIVGIIVAWNGVLRMGFQVQAPENLTF